MRCHASFEGPCSAATGLERHGRLALSRALRAREARRVTDVPEQNSPALGGARRNNTCAHGSVFPGFLQLKQNGLFMFRTSLQIGFCQYICRCVPRCDDAIRLITTPPPFVIKRPTRSAVDKRIYTLSVNVADKRVGLKSAAISCT